jgi:hypothetical protein
MPLGSSLFMMNQIKVRKLKLNVFQLDKRAEWYALFK